MNPTTRNASTNTESPSSEEIRAEMQRVLGSDQFVNSTRASDFLQFVVDESIAGRASRLKGQTIAMAVYGRDSEFDADSDPIVRVQAGQIRRRLSLYYADVGIDDSIRIELPKGSYAPQFVRHMSVNHSDRQTTSSANLSLPRGPCIAVLPFDVIGDPDEKHYFGDGIAEELINYLTKFRDLSVVARSASFKYRGQAHGIRHIGEDLGVEYVLCGSIRHTQQVIRVSIQLIDAATCHNLYADRFDCELTPANLLDVEEEIANEVVSKIAEPYGVIARHGKQRIHETRTENMSSYGSILRYYQFEANPTIDEHAALRDLLEQVTKNDPEFASGWAALAAIYLDEYRFGFNAITERSPLPVAKAAAERAVQADPQHSMAHHFLFCTCYHLGDMHGFKLAGDTALKLNPNHPDMLADYGFYRCISGDWSGGIKLAKRALAISLLPPGWFYSAFSLNYFRQGLYAEALDEAEKIKTPHIFADSMLRAVCHAKLNNRAEAGKACAELCILYPDVLQNIDNELAKWRIEDSLAKELRDALILAENVRNKQPQLESLATTPYPQK